jgi:hypothetical protein
MTRTTLLDSSGSNAHMITEIIRLDVQSQHPLVCNTFPIQHDGTRQLTQWLRKQGHLALSDIQHQFPIIPHFICLLRRLRNIGPIPISTKAIPQPTLPSSLSSIKSRGPCDTTVAPERMYNQPTMLSRGFEPCLHPGAPLHLFLNDAFSNTPTRPLLLM